MLCLVECFGHLNGENDLYCVYFVWPSFLVVVGIVYFCYNYTVMLYFCCSDDMLCLTWFVVT